MRVALDLLQLAPDSGGVGTHARELVRALRVVAPALELVLHVGRRPPEWVDACGAEVVRWPVQVAQPSATSAARLLLAQWAGVAVDAARRRLDVLHGIANVVPPVLPGVASVVSVNDVIWRHHRRTMGLRATVGMEVVTALSVRRAARVIAPSAAARDALVLALGVPRTRIEVVPLGVAPDHGPAPPEQDVRHALGLGDAPVVLAVAQKRRHKNLLALVRALPHVPDAVLVLPGTPTPHEQELRAEAERLGVGERVRTPGWLPEADVRALRRLAAVAALPSFEEGFGLPVLEAMAAGTPVVCARVPALVEVAGGAAVLVDPHEPEDVARGLSAALHDEGLRPRLVQAGRARAAALTWEQTARRTVEVYDRVRRG